MRNILTFLCMASALLLGAWGCQKKEVNEPLETVELRYRVEDSYNLDARNAKAFTIVVTSTAPWTITSEHPDWCIIEQESGDAVDADKVRIGQGEQTILKVQYYDNLQLDDRTDVLTIASEIWTAKKVTVNQKGIAYLDVPEDELEYPVIKDGGDIEFHINSNQNWTIEIVDGDWISLEGSASGENDGVIKLVAAQNAAEQRYATINVYDRHGVLMQTIHFTQDGVQLDPAALQIRAAYDAASASLDVVANARWKAVKDSENDTWFDIVNPNNEGTGTLQLTFKENTGADLRQGTLTIESVSDDPDAFTAKRTITVKQGYKVSPVRHVLDNDEMGSWKSDWTNTPVYTKGVGTLFTSQARLHNGEMPYGTYTFRWSAIDPASRVRLWFCYSDSQEIKFNIKAASGTAVFDYNYGNSAKPVLEYDSVPVDISQPIEMTLRFEESGDKYCHVIYYINGEQVQEFYSSDDTMNMVLAGKDVNLYFGVDTGGSAICEWYEYTAPVKWGD